ncbi:Helix-hairpin-helix DNA-binding protein [Psychromonas ingrahamii 37]|uniref:Helix-hairpin-helix DNA-binding protein n=1 Tax=Psychromonas ingrahamii (strain DSM 17664 / CCUG 51855 / 37) TaxID=357804 RepID=A1SZ47_PSYIN|nr:DNA-binding protein [Psychromonas ingrahamii]ABM04762.1 Helix-hairpin-helix DNA-binding protein [Psychromonas ingrahamii 37]
MMAFNHEVGEKLREIAALLKTQRANPFRYQAYFHAANTLDNLSEDLRELVQAKGMKGLTDLPAIGSGIAQCIYEYVATGRISRLESLQGESDPIGLFQSIPTVGRTLAQRIYDRLHIDTLESLENATRNGQLDKVEGLGVKRKEAIESWLLKHFSERRQTSIAASSLIPVGLLLKVDTEYRSKAAAGKLPQITPKRFNPDNKAWLPILHITCDHWHFSALFSNSERAHKLHHVFDWVIIFFSDDNHREGQHTVVTETHGSLLGKRVVRGREGECQEYYQSQS